MMNVRKNNLTGNYNQEDAKHKPEKRNILENSNGRLHLSKSSNMQIHPKTDSVSPE